MNIRIPVLVAALLILVSVGVLTLDKDASETGLPATRSPLPESAAHASTKPRPIPSASGPVRVVGLTINTPVHTGADPASDDPFGVELAFMGSLERTRLALEFEHAEGGILGIDDDACALDSFRDDRGTDLIKKDDPFGPFEMMSRVADDGRHLVFTIPSDVVPARGASRLFAEGTLAVQVAQRSETFTTDEISLAAGTEFTVGGFDFRVTQVGDAQWGDGSEITLETKRDTVSIVRYALVSPDGTQHALEPSMSFSGMGSWQQGLRADEVPARGRLEIEVWQDLSIEKVPFQVETGLGLR